MQPQKKKKQVREQQADKEYTAYVILSDSVE